MRMCMRRHWRSLTRIRRHTPRPMSIHRRMRRIRSPKIHITTRRRTRTRRLRLRISRSPSRRANRRMRPHRQPLCRRRRRRRTHIRRRRNCMRPRQTSTSITRLPRLLLLLLLYWTRHITRRTTYPPLRGRPLHPTARLHRHTGWGRLGGRSRG